MRSLLFIALFAFAAVQWSFNPLAPSDPTRSIAAFGWTKPSLATPFQGCKKIKEPGSFNERCCSLDISAEQIGHWCPSERISVDRSESGRCTIHAKKKTPGVRWSCSAKSSAVESEKVIASCPTGPSSVEAPLYRALALSRSVEAATRREDETPRVAGLYSRLPGEDFKDALARIETTFGPVSTFLWQKTFYAEPSLASDVKQIFKAIDEKSTPFIPQISLDALTAIDETEPRIEDTKDLANRICDPKSKLGKKAQTWAKYLAEKGSPIQLRPLSEMNVPGDIPYHFFTQGTDFGARVSTDHGKAEDFARVWGCLRNTFRQAGADNVKFYLGFTGTLCANPENHLKNQRANQEMMRALKLIPSDQIDGFSVHPYCRPPAALVSAERMIQPWIQAIEKTAHAGKPMIIGEMGIDKSYPPAARARWICEAYEFARSQPDRIQGATYFDLKLGIKDWTIDPGSIEAQAMTEALQLGLQGPPQGKDFCKKYR